MTKKEKRLQKVQRNQNNVSFDDLRKVLEDHGFEMRQSSASSHFFFRAEIDGRVWTLTLPYRRPHVLAVYVRAALEKIDEIRALSLADDEDNEDEAE